MSTPTPVTAPAIRAALPPRTPALDIEIHDSLDSTNTEAKRLAHTCLAGEASLPRPRLILARTQTAGRGRLGRDFYSPDGTGLYMTLLYATDRPLADAVAVTGAAAVAVATTLEAMTGDTFLVKWVNDIYRGAGKVCGILTEAVSGTEGQPHYIAVGIGINVTTAAFPAGFRAPAAAVTAEGQTPPDVSELAARVTSSLLSLLEEPAAPAVVAEYRAHSMLTRSPTAVTVTRGSAVFEGVAEGIDHDYSLLVRLPDGRVEVLTGGEVSVRPTAH